MHKRVNRTGLVVSAHQAIPRTRIGRYLLEQNTKGVVVDGVLPVNVRLLPLFSSRFFNLPERCKLNIITESVDVPLELDPQCGLRLVRCHFSP